MLNVCQVYVPLNSKDINWINPKFIKATSSNKPEYPQAPMLRLNQKLIKFSIINPEIAHTSKRIKGDSQFDLYPIVGLRQIKLGALSLNQPNNQNSMTVQMMQEMFRFLNSYHNDNTIENIWMQNRGNMFSSGVNLYEMKNNDEYLDRLYGLVGMIAKENKPIISYCRGSVRNVGAYVLSMSAFVMSNGKDVSLRIDEASKGFVPLAGGTHRLSRLPANIGVYLAITGKKLNANEMSRLGFIHGVSKEDVTSKMMRHEITKSNLFFRRKLKVNFEDSQPLEAEEWQNMLKKREQFDQQTATNQAQIIDSQESIFTKFAMNQYRLAQVNYENTAVNPYNSFKAKPGRTINNYYMLRHQKALKYLQEKHLIELSQFQNVRLPGLRLDKIDGIFGRKTLKEVLTALEEDGSQWATETLHEIRKMDPLAVSLTFEMLKRAEELSWDQCLDMEYTVGKRLINQSKLVLKPTIQGTKYVFENYYSSQTKIEEIADDIVEGFFAPAENYQEKLQMPYVPNYSLLPNCDYKHIPDSARHMLNKHFFSDTHLHNQMTEVDRYLKQEKIYSPHKSFEVDALREKIYQKEEAAKIQQRETKRIEAMLSNSIILKEYVQKKQAYIDNLTKEQLEATIDKYVKEVFNGGLMEKRFAEFQQTAEVIGKKNKMRLFKTVRDMLVKSVVLDGQKVEKLNSERNYKFNGTVYFDDEGKSYLESKSPFIEQRDPALNRLMNDEIGSKLEISQQFTQQEGNEVLDADMGNNSLKQLRDYHGDKFGKAKLAQIYENIIQRYNHRPFEWDRSFAIQELVVKAAETSEQLAAYLEWTNQEFFTTIVNQPAEEKTYNLLGQKVLQKIKQKRQDEKDQLREVNQNAQNLIGDLISSIYKTGKSVQKYQKHKGIIEGIVPQQSFPSELKGHFHEIYSQVLNHFMQKYLSKTPLNQSNQLGDFDNWINKNLDERFTEFYKWDIQYTFSYLAILRLKQILLAVQRTKEAHRDTSVSEAVVIVNALNQNKLNFSETATVQAINQTISRFLYKMLDMHTIAKSKIRLPQTKLLDYMNRLKVGRQSNDRSNYPLSFESIMLMIGKDRLRIYNKTMKDYLPTQPQYMLEFAGRDYKSFKDKTGQSQGRFESNLLLGENLLMGKEGGKQNGKQLVSGFFYYLAHYEALVQKASGKYNFINQETLDIDLKKIKKQFAQILNMSISNQQWVQDATKKSLQRLFEGRLDIEKQLTKGELKAFDEDLKQALNPEIFRVILKHKIQAQISQTKKYFTKARHYDYERDKSDLNEEMYCDFRKNVKNRDAFRRLTNLHLATKVRDDYFTQNFNRVVSPEQAEDFASQKKQFADYERFPQETRDRMIRESLDYGPERQFEKDLKVRGEQKLQGDSRASALQLMKFEDDEKKINIKRNLTDFDKQLMALKQTLVKDNDKDIKSLYQKLEALI